MVITNVFSVSGPQMVSSPAYKTTNSTTHDNITDIAIRSPSIGMVHSMGTFHVVPVLNNIYAYSNHTHKGSYM
jgi:hypothetical protein